MAPRRRKADAWWHARPSVLAALLFAPAVWVQIVGGVVSMFDRIGNMETDMRALRADVARHDIELRELRKLHP